MTKKKDINTDYANEYLIRQDLMKQEHLTEEQIDKFFSTATREVLKDFNTWWHQDEGMDYLEGYIHGFLAGSKAGMCIECQKENLI